MSRSSGHNEGDFSMVEERVTEVETPSGNTHTHTTVVSDGERSGGGSTWVIVLLLIVLAAVAIWFFSGMSGSEVAKDNAVAEAAGEVGDAANQVGDAAQEAADSVTN
jgi:flagellar basal body-associated protein FliL